MSDLISRSEVIKALEECNLDKQLFEKDVFEKIYEIQTAYDIDKVVEELEIRVNESNNNCLCEMHENGHTLDFENENGRIKGLKEEIEIVKQGSVGTDDVCEWRTLSNPHLFTMWETGCRNQTMLQKLQVINFARTAERR